MAVHDYIVDNQNGANFRSDLNNALAAIVSNNSSATAPTTTYAFMMWADTANDLLKQRNAADSAWVDILTLSTGAVSNAEVADNAITLAKMAHGTDGEIITYDASGAPATVGVGTTGQVLTSNGAGSAPSMQDAGGGKVLQVVNTQTGTLGTGTTTMNWDNTIPQITEGNEFMTLVFTPVSATSKLKIEVVINVEDATAGHVVCALFVGTTANALAAASHYQPANYEANTKFTHYMTSGVTSTLTFRVRAGGASVGTCSFNGQNGNAYLGGAFASSITITEIEA
jgi:hypothetical protein